MAGISTLGQALVQIERIKTQQSLMSQYSVQLATGKKTTKFTGLGPDILTSQRSRSTIQSLTTYKSNITHASRRINLTLNAVKEFQAQARKFLELMSGLTQESTHQDGDIIYYDDPTTTGIEETPIGMTSSDPDEDFANLITLSGQVYTLFQELINAKDGDRYLLAGADTRTKPITDTGLLDTALTSLISGWKDGTISTNNLIADLSDRTATSNADALTDSIIGYSSNLSGGNAGKVYVRVDESYEVEYTVLGNSQAFRDILVAAAYLKNDTLPPIADAYIPPNEPTPPLTPDVDGAPGDTIDDQKNNFFSVFSTLKQSVATAISDLNSIIGDLTQTQARLEEISKNHTEESNLLQSITSEVEDIDQNEVALKLTTLQTQLDISYRVAARVQQLSLANYL